MKYRVMRIEGTREFVESIVTGAPDKGWHAMSWVGLWHAKGQAKILSRNHPRYTYEIQDENYAPVAVYKDGQEL